MKLKDVKPGKEFKYAGYEWIKLEDSAEGTKVIAADKVEDQAFDTEDRNNWKESTLREYLNNDFLEYLYDEGAAEEDFLTVVSDFTADDGLKNYGTSEDKIALITCGDYRKYRSLIPMIDGWWWTITPWSCNPSHSYYVRSVNASGALLYYNAYYGSCGVRPLIKLAQGTEVYLIDEGETTEHSIDTLTDLIKKWAKDRCLDTADPAKQLNKLVEEVGELAGAMIRHNEDDIVDAVGDIYVVLTILAMQLGLNIEECIATVYEEIKDRKGEMVNGIFVKQEDIEA